jgi:hypothetical protein
MIRQPYDSVGALNGLFAPAYIHGDPTSDAAVQAWMVAHPRSPGVGTFVPSEAAAATPVDQSVNQQRDAIATQLVANSNNAGTGSDVPYGVQAAQAFQQTNPYAIQAANQRAAAQAALPANSPFQSPNPYQSLPDDSTVHTGSGLSVVGPIPFGMPYGGNSPTS